MPLYQIQDGDRPCWVVATTWDDALTQWRAVIARENDDMDEAEPEGIARICDDDELIIHGELQSEVPFVYRRYGGRKLDQSPAGGE
jgi:hypothetical protein